MPERESGDHTALLPARPHCAHPHTPLALAGALAQHAVGPSSKLLVELALQLVPSVVSQHVCPPFSFPITHIRPTCRTFGTSLPMSSSGNTPTTCGGPVSAKPEPPPLPTDRQAARSKSTHASHPGQAMEEGPGGGGTMGWGWNGRIRKRATMGRGRRG